MSTHHYQKETAMFRVASRMPPLHHFLPEQPFNISKSEVVRWMIEQPEIQQTIFNMARRHSMITYDLETHTWRGVHWRADQ